MHPLGEEEMTLPQHCLLITNDHAVVEDVRFDALLGRSDNALISAKMVCQLEP